MRRILSCLLTLALCLSGMAQNSNGLLRSIDGITRNTRLGQAGKMPADSPFVSFRAAQALPATGSLSPSREFGFVTYLIGNDLSEDAFTLLSSPDYHDTDTLRFLRGWAAYSTRRLPEAVAEFSLVGPESPFYDQSSFFSIISDAHMRQFGKALNTIDTYSQNRPGGPYKELEALERAGLALLLDNQSLCLEAMTGFTYSSYTLTEAEETLRDIYNERYTDRKRKKPATAALLSAIIPGAGQFYAGEKGAGAAAMLGIGSMAALTAENWKRHGADNWKTILFGASTAALYIGNIYGGWISVSIHNNDIRNAQDTAVLYHIHIPLRSIFQ